jgi:hypothetical protein
MLLEKARQYEAQISMNAWLAASSKVHQTNQ